MLIKLLVMNVLVQFAVGYPAVVINAGAKSDQAQQERHDVDGHDVTVKLGSSGFSAEGGYNKAAENKHALAEDAGKYSEESAGKKQRLDQSDFLDEKFRQEGGGSAADFDSKGAHKKGHHKAGFHNTYQKDESGSNSSFYDDNDDQGGHYVRQSQKGTYGDTIARNNQASHLDGNYHSKQDEKHGNYDQGGSYDRNLADRANYNQEKYYDDHEQQARSNGGNQHGAYGGYSDERYYHQRPNQYDHPYYQPHYRDQSHYVRENYDRSYYPTKKTITIYEDPRVYDQNRYYRNYNRYPQHSGDSVELDVRPPYRTDVAPYY